MEDEKLNIAKDAFLETYQYKNYELFRIEDRKMDNFLEDKKAVFPNYRTLNLNHWMVYYKLRFFFIKKEISERLSYNLKKH